MLLKNLFEQPLTNTHHQHLGYFCELTPASVSVGESVGRSVNKRTDVTHTLQGSSNDSKIKQP